MKEILKEVSQMVSLMERIGLKNCNHYRNVFEQAYDNSFYESESLNESEANPEESQKVKEMILSNEHWIRNNYRGFIDSLRKSTRLPFLSQYTPEDLKNMGVQTYQLYGYNIGYALKPDSDGYTDIISVHNNEPTIKGVGDALVDSAKANGGDKLDHYDGFLSDLYSRHGFEEYDRYKWDDQYASKDWDYERYGRPDVVMRRLKK